MNELSKGLAKEEKGKGFHLKSASASKGLSRLFMINCSRETLLDQTFLAFSVTAKLC